MSEEKKHYLVTIGTQRLVVEDVSHAHSIMISTSRARQVKKTDRLTWKVEPGTFRLSVEMLGPTDFEDPATDVPS